MGLDDALEAQSQAKADRSGVYFNSGLYELEVEEFYYNKGHKGEFLGCSFKVLSSQSTGQVDRSNRPIIPNAVGTMVSAGMKISGEYGAQGQSKFKSMMLAVANKPENELGSPAEYKSALNRVMKEQILKGRKVRLQAVVAPQVGDKTKDYTSLKFSPFIEAAK